MAAIERIERIRVECLGCGEVRLVPGNGLVRLDPGECPRCRYVGWAPSAELTEPMRRRIRERPVERRANLYAV